MPERNNVVLILVDAEFSDCEDLWIWRNDPYSREMSLEIGKISWDSHRKWFQNCLKDRKKKIFIGKTLNGEKIGMCRFDNDKKTKEVEVSINLAKKFRGKKFSQLFLKNAIELFTKTKNFTLKATIKKKNLASIKCFTNCGFEFINEDNKNNYYKLKV